MKTQNNIAKKVPNISTVLQQLANSFTLFTVQYIYKLVYKPLAVALVQKTHFYSLPSVLSLRRWKNSIIQVLT